MRLVVMRGVVLAAVVSLAVERPGLAQSLKRRELERLGVDLVEVVSGPRLRGAILERDAEGNVTMAVRRAWLKAHAPRLHGEVVAAEENEGPGPWLVRLRERLPLWIEELEQDGADWDGRDRLLEFLRKELERVEQELAEAARPDVEPQDRALPAAGEAAGDEPAKPEFVRVVIPAERIRRAYQQPLERRRVVAVAWRERLEGVESKPVSELSRALDKLGIDPSVETPDLSDRLPTAPDSDRQWAARKALVEYAFGRRLEFQGAGDFVVRTPKEGQPADVPGLMAGMLREQFNRELGDLLNEPGLGVTPARQPGWQETATKAAERAGMSGVRVTRVASDLRAGRASVESRFLARMPDGTWEAVRVDRATADATAANKELDERIRQDPQFQQIDRFTELLGGLAGEEQVRQAVRFGAATIEAQQAVDARWWEFRERVTKRLDGAWAG